MIVPPEAAVSGEPVPHPDPHNSFFGGVGNGQFAGTTGDTVFQKYICRECSGGKTAVSSSSCRIVIPPLEHFFACRKHGIMLGNITEIKEFRLLFAERFFQPAEHQFDLLSREDNCSCKQQECKEFSFHCSSFLMGFLCFKITENVSAWFRRKLPVCRCPHGNPCRGRLLNCYAGSAWIRFLLSPSK